MAITPNNGIPFFKTSNYEASIFVISPIITYGLGYLLSGYSTYAASTIVKFTMFLYIMATGVVLERIYSIENNVRSKGHHIIFLTLLTPAFVMIAFETPSLDLVPIFLVTYSYYLLRYSGRGDITFGLAFFYTLPLVISIFFYWYPLVIVPALIIYSRRNKERRNMIIAITVLSVIFEIIDIFIIRGSFYNYLYAATPQPSRGPSFQAINFGLLYFLKFGEYSYYGLLAFILLLLPLIFRKLGVPEAPALAIIFILFLYTSPLSGYNEYAFIYPFTILTLIGGTRKSINYWTMITLNLVPLIGVFFYNIFYGAGNLGILYQTYYIFHIFIWPIPPNEISSLLTAFNLLLMIGIIISIILLLTPRYSGKVHQEYFDISQHSSGARRSLFSFKSAVIIVAIVLVLVSSSFVYNNYNNEIHANSLDNFPIKAFSNISDPIASGYIVPVNGRYEVSRNSIILDNYNWPITMNLSTQEKDVTFNGSVSATGNLNSNLSSLILTNNFSLGVSKTLLADFVNPVYLNDTFSNAKEENSSVYYGGQSIDLNSFNGSNFYSYNITPLIKKYGEGYFSFIFTESVI